LIFGDYGPLFSFILANDLNNLYNIKMVELKTAEHVAHYMVGNISLSRFDKRFVESLQVLKQVTTNQVELFYKIIYKYRRQLSKNELDADKLIYLPWTSKVIESVPQYTDGHVSIEGNLIIFKCPYNKNFIDAFRKEDANTFVWNKELKQYSAEYSTHSLKLLVYTANKFFKVVHYCNIVIDLLDTIKEYKDIKYWQPTLTRINGNLFIVATTEQLDEALCDMVLNTTPITISKLVYHGVHIDESIYDVNDKRQTFISNRVYEMEVSDMLNIVPWLTEIGCDYVVLTGNKILTEVRKRLRDNLKIANIKVDPETKWITKSKETSSYNFPVVIRFRTSRDISYDEPIKAGKIVQLVNSQPIDIK
jgi:hypothetical protein